MFAESFDSNTLIDGKYQLVELIGTGGMGQVWKARDIRLEEERLVAIKFIRWQNDDEHKMREMRALARLDHPNIIHLIGFGETPNGTPYLVMNFVPGGSLHNHLNQGLLDATTRDRVLKELCDALDYVHSQNVVHRDLKPANILFDDLGHVRIGDFGLAKLVETTRVASIPGGTPRFQAPEQSAQAIHATLERGEMPIIDHRADIYALGVIAWLLFTGHYPDDPPVSSSDPLSPGLERVLKKAIEHHREDRYDSAGEFWRALDSATSPKPKPKPKLPTWAWGIAGSAVLFLAVAGIWLTRPVPAPSPTPTIPISTDTPTSVSPQSFPDVQGRATSTPSVTPSPIPSPTPTATPLFAVVIEDQIDIYDGPGPEYNVLGQVNKEDRLPILGRSENRAWLCADCFGLDSWIRAESVATIADIQILPVFTPPPTPVNPHPVIDKITLFPTPVQACSAISVTCEVTYHGGGELTYTWEASEGRFDEGEGNSVTYHVPETVGSQTITVTVQDQVGQENTDSVPIEITSAIPPPGKSKPAGVFGQIWQDCDTRQKLGWAVGEDTATDGAQQYFDNGMMFWRKDTDQIYVLILDGGWYVYQDTWEEGDDAYSCASDVVPRDTPPTHIRGFGRVWCEQLGGPNATIGWAQDNEQSYPAHWQTFEHGLMGEGSDKYVYVLYVNEDGEPAWFSHSSFASTNSSNSNAASLRFRIGDRAWVCTTYESLVMRAGPGLDGSEITRLEPGVSVTVVDGPSYANSRLWWKVQDDAENAGWVAEGSDHVDPYYICPEE